MRFRTRLLVIFALTITGAAALVTGAIAVLARRAFERMDEDRRAALIEQFKLRLAEQGKEVVSRVEQAILSEQVRIATDPSLADPMKDAATLAATLSLDYLDITGPEGVIVSSAHWPARFRYKNEWAIAPEDLTASDAFLATIPTQDGSALGLIAIRAKDDVRVMGGKRIDAAFLASLGLAPGMSVSLVDPAERDTRRQQLQRAGNAVTAISLDRRGKTMGVLLISNSLAEQTALESGILRIGLIAVVAGIALGLLMAWWATERVTRPVEKLADGARAVAAGNWESRVNVASAGPADEIGELAVAFNRMTEQLIEQRERAIQAERVAAWRELARRLAHELKNPLFPLQITVENLRRARQQTPGEFDEVFTESTDMLLAELGKLKEIIGRFSDFAKMPAPQLEEVDVNTLARDAVRLFDAQLQARKIDAALDLPAPELRVHADPEQLGRALRNLVLNAIDVMPEGGRLRLHARPCEAGARIEVSDTGAGLTEEECSRLFTPYYTTKQHGTGLGLAIVQSVVSDHKGRIWVESAPGQGSTFIMELPVKP